MARFLNSQDLRKEIKNVFLDANEELLIVSPFIKLDSHIKKLLDTHKENKFLRIQIMFGKNEDKLTKSLLMEDLDYFKSFPNVSIFWHKNLHAKYYANEVTSIITSMNLHSYSRENNIEVGMLMEPKFTLPFATKINTKVTKEQTADIHATEYFENLFEDASEIFRKCPKILDKKLLGFKKTYGEPEIDFDNTHDFFDAIYKEIEHQNEKFYKLNRGCGYCIRTGEKINFNIFKPFSNKGFKEWLDKKDKYYPEQYCHFTGEKTEGKNSFRYPVLNKNWKQALMLQNELHPK